MLDGDRQIGARAAHAISLPAAAAHHSFSSKALAMQSASYLGDTTAASAVCKLNLTSVWGANSTRLPSAKKWTPCPGHSPRFNYTSFLVSAAGDEEQHYSERSPRRSGSTSIPDTPDAPQNAAQIYVALCALQAAVALPHIVLPVETGLALFASGAGIDLVSQFFLEQMLGLGYFATSITFNILASGALKGELHKPDYKRLNLGVAVAALALTAVRIVHWDLQTSLGHVQTVLQGALTVGVPLYFVSRTSQSNSLPAAIAQRVLSDMGDLLRPRNLNSAVYSLLTAAFLGLGGACILAPPGVLNGVLAHANTPDALLVWQSYGGALLLLPSWSFTLKKAADQGISPLPQHQMLNLGLMLMGFGHLAILAPLWSTAEAGPMLHQFVAFWGAVGAIGTFGGLSGVGKRHKNMDLDI
ncbi:hypothetical protein CVIRNUC_000688 [Coccomyxa viridis]|uniref:Uncharacterized protein n=1 Tax=Coccomyxa viridis TaxID=1274662 RepID=A0AAV1HSK4_9CHLO|nr:hypothetical protein CVIRNUC_000688 [Coccomyxa viridis]